MSKSEDDGWVWWGGQRHKADWRLVVENPRAMDPCEVIYRLCLVDTDGSIVARDAEIRDAEHGWGKRLKAAMEKKVMAIHVDPPPKPRAVSLDSNDARNE